MRMPRKKNWNLKNWVSAFWIDFMGYPEGTNLSVSMKKSANQTLTQWGLFRKATTVVKSQRHDLQDCLT